MPGTLQILRLRPLGSLPNAPSPGNAVRQWECIFQVSPFPLSGFPLSHLLCSYLWGRLLGGDRLERAKEIAREGGISGEVPQRAASVGAYWRRGVGIRRPDPTTREEEVGAFIFLRCSLVSQEVRMHQCPDSAGSSQVQESGLPGGSDLATIRRWALDYNLYTNYES